MNSSYPLNEEYLSKMETYLDEMSELQKDLLALFSEEYSAGVDNFQDALDYAENQYDRDFPDSFDYFGDFCIPLKNYWREFSWCFVGASIHTAPNIVEPAVNRDDVVEQTVLEQLQYWSANERNSFYSHPTSWVAGSTSIDEGVVNRVLAKVQGEMLSFEPPDSLYYATISGQESVGTRGDIGRLVFTSVDQAIEECERFSIGEYEMSVVEINPGEDTLVSPFFEQENVPAHSDKYVLSYVKGADISIVESDLSFE